MTVVLKAILLASVLAGSFRSAAEPPPMSGKIVYYSQTYGDWTCPATERCGIAARQGVTLLPGETCIATLNREDRDRTGMLLLSGRTIRVRVCDHAAPADRERIQARGIVGELPYPTAQTVPGMISSGWVTGTLYLDPLAPAPRAPPAGRPLGRVATPW